MPSRVLKDQPRLGWSIPLLASPIGVLLWIIDERTRDLYHAAIKAGMQLEGDKGGFCTELNKELVPKGKSAFSRTTQSGALNLLFVGSTVVLAVATLVLLGMTTRDCLPAAG